MMWLECRRVPGDKVPPSYPVSPRREVLGEYRGPDPLIDRGRHDSTQLGQSSEWISFFFDDV